MIDVSFHLFNDDVCFMTFKVVLKSLEKHDSVTILNTYVNHPCNLCFTCDVIIFHTHAYSFSSEIVLKIISD